MWHWIARAAVAAVLFAGTPSGAFAFDASTVEALKTRDAIEWRGIVVSTDRVTPFYELPGAQPVWVRNGALTPEGDALFAAITDAASDGLVSSDYLPLALRQLDPLAGPADDVGLELALSSAFLSFARDLHAGRTTPSITDPEIVIARKPADPAQWLSMVQRDGVARTLQRLRPQHTQYFQLRQLLSGYQALADRGGWPGVDQGDVLKPGMNDARVLQLRQNLMARGYSGIDGGIAPELYDDALVPVVE
ncbi:MAG: hypothetical protein AAFP99_06035, partial [Pseudomonadota bacterium]